MPFLGIKLKNVVLSFKLLIISYPRVPNRRQISVQSVLIYFLRNVDYPLKYTYQLQMNPNQPSSYHINQLKITSHASIPHKNPFYYPQNAPIKPKSHYLNKSANYESILKSNIF